MPIPYEILREGRMALFSYPRAFEVADITAMVVVYQQDTLDKATKKIYSITDLSAVTRFPTNILSSSMGLIKNSHPMAGPTFLVTPNAFINQLATILSK